MRVARARVVGLALGCLVSLAACGGPGPGPGLSAGPSASSSVSESAAALALARAMDADPAVTESVQSLRLVDGLPSVTVAGSTATVQTIGANTEAAGAPAAKLCLAVASIAGAAVAGTGLPGGVRTIVVAAADGSAIHTCSVHAP